jgi:hypothetical protein
VAEGTTHGVYRTKRRNAFERSEQPASDPREYRDHAIAGLFTASRELATPISQKPKRRIGFVVDD